MEKSDEEPDPDEVLSILEEKDARNWLEAECIRRFGTSEVGPAYAHVVAAVIALPLPGGPPRRAQVLEAAKAALDRYDPTRETRSP